MPERRLRVAIIIGSTRQGRIGPAVADWFAGQAAGRGDLDVDVIDLAEARLPEILPVDGGPRPRAVRDLAPWLAAADAFVIVTPEYNSSFPAALKNAIDWYRDEWRAKPVGFVCYGGPAGGLRAVEQLRLVFAELDATCVRQNVSLRDHRALFGGASRPAARTGCDAAAGALLGQLSWWAEALRRQRARRPYSVPAAAPPAAAVGPAAAAPAAAAEPQPLRLAPDRQTRSEGLACQ
jgi:NAD(P)H-dependent FMN reductase